MAVINTPDITIGNAIDRIADYFIAAILQKKDLKKLRVPFLWGPPGIGKTEAAYQIADLIEKATGKHVVVRMVYLPNCSMIEFLGIPTLSPDGTLTRNVTPEIFKPESNENTIILTFFDEFNKASKALLDAALQIILNRQFWVHKFPDNSLFMAAGNPEDVGGVLESNLRPEMNDRFRHYNVQPNFSSWLKWAKANGINYYVREYLTYDHSKLYDRNPDNDDVAFPTPRSWKYVSDYMDLMFKDPSDFLDMHYDICGDIGVGTAVAFEKWCQVADKLPKVKEIFRGKEKKYPQTQDEMDEVIRRMMAYADKNKEDITRFMLDNACRYADRFPEDFRTLFYDHLLSVEEIRLKMASVPAYKAREAGRF